MASPIHPGAVAWTGENPGIYLKDAKKPTAFLAFSESWMEKK